MPDVIEHPFPLPDAVLRWAILAALGGTWWGIVTVVGGIIGSW